MKSLHRILSALCATTLCLFLPMTTACSMFGEKDSSSDSSSNTSTSSDSSSSADSSIEARHGHPGDFSDYFPDSMPDAVMARITKALKIGHIELRAASIDRDDEQSDGLVLSGVAAATQNITGKQFRIQAGHTRPSSAWCD